MLNFILSVIPKGGKIAHSIYPVLKVPILITNDSLTSEESNPKRPFANPSYVEQIMSI